VNKTLSASFAMSVAALIASGCEKSPETESGDPAATQKTEPVMAMEEGTDKSGAPSESVKCLGINECKGKSACHTESHACAGQNACKGKGWIEVPESECEDKGGKVL
jgi:hypothetical protein